MVSGVVVVWHFELLPRWALAMLIAREVFLLFAGRCGAAARDRPEDQLVRAPGACGPTMSAIFFAIVGLETLAQVLLYIGLAMSLAAAVPVRARRAARAA